jgi:hypothetical protein
MNRNVLALTVLVAIASFVPAAQAGYLCEDEDGDIAICLKRIPYTSFIPRTLPTEVPNSIERKVEKKVDSVVVEAPPPAPRAADVDVKIVEKPATVRIPDIPRVCKKYFPNLGEMLPISCDE